MDLLILLAERSGEVVARTEILNSVWHDSCVSDDTVNVAVSQRRRALGDKPRAPLFVATVPKRGYRWIAPVEWKELEVIAPMPKDEAPMMQRQASRWRAWPIAAAVALLGLVALVVHQTSGDSASTKEMPIAHAVTPTEARVAAEYRSLKIRGWRLLNQRDLNSIRAARHSTL